MSELEKLKARLKSLPKDFTYSEAKSLLTKLEFEEYNKGKTSDSRVAFHKVNIYMHKPNFRKEIKRPYVRILLEEVIELDEIK